MSLSALDEIIASLQALPKEELARVDKQVNAVVGNLKFIPSPGAQTRAYYSEADILLFGGQPGGGKRIACDTPIPVTLCTDASGFKKHGELQAGDKVFSPLGLPVEVLKRHETCYNPTAYDVHFSTGEVIKADAEHLWQTWDRQARLRKLQSSDEWRDKRKAMRPSRAVCESKKPWVSKLLGLANSARVHEIAQPTPTIRTTKQILETLYRQDGGLNHSIDVCKPLVLPDIDLPVDPYLFGLWLGDGFTKGTQIIMMTKDWATISHNLPLPSHITVEGVEQKRKQEVEVRTFSELAYARKMKGKRIPAIYKRASYQQRLELLRGMMDTDGTVDNRGQCELGFSNEVLARDALEVINSLGIKSAVTCKTFKKAEHNDHYRMKFIADVCVFKMPRKAQRQQAIKRETCNRRYITAITPCEPVPMNCITVEGGLYCVGSTFITTHNSGLLIGTALNCHDRSMIVRKQFTDLQGLVDNAKGIVGSGDGFIGGNRPMYRKSDGGVIHFEGMGDGLLDTGKQGNPHDFIGVDEGAQIPEQAIRMLKGWNRTTKKGQRCRMIIASNPPLDATGEWMADFFAPWLNDKYPAPAKDGELRWFIFNEEDKSEEVANSDPFERNGRKFYPHSRSFIRSTLEDNPYLDAEAYKRQLDMLPEPWRTILQTGNFLLGRKDQENQIIPTEWVRAAMARWTPEKPKGVPMTAISIDPAAGGDETTVGCLYDSYFTEIIAERVPDGRNNAAMLLTNRRDNALPVIDMSGGYGGSVALLLQENNIEYVAYKGAEATTERARDGSKLPFANRRTKDLWRLREALDPNQDGGSQIALPPNNKLLADLTSVCFKPMVSKQVLQAESKDEVKKKIGRSPDAGDMVTMLWSVGGNRVATIKGGWHSYNQNNHPQVLVSYENRRR